MTKLIPDETLMRAAQQETQGGGYPLPEGGSTVRELTNTEDCDGAINEGELFCSDCKGNSHE